MPTRWDNMPVGVSRGKLSLPDTLPARLFVVGVEDVSGELATSSGCVRDLLVDVLRVRVRGWVVAIGVGGLLGVVGRVGTVRLVDRVLLAVSLISSRM